MKILSYFLTILGILFTAFGLFPIIFLYPYKGLNPGLDWNYLLFHDDDRWFWQLGIMALILGIVLLYKQRKKVT